MGEAKQLTKTCLWGLFLIVFGAGFAMAAPNQINYQGVLNDSGGNQVNGDLPMEFALYDADIAGNMVWGESHGTVTVSNGIYNVLLGSGTPLPTSPESLSPDVFSNSDLWLQVTVNSEVMTPRQQLASTPYALQAGKAGCEPGDFVSCYTGSPATMNEGLCTSGQRYCLPDGSGFGICIGETIPGTEICDGLDNDCNGTVDDDYAADATTWYVDADSDNYGEISNHVNSCSQPIGYIDNSLDCNDTEATVNPGQIEACDGLDNNCDTLVDNDCSLPPACTAAEQQIGNDCQISCDGDFFCTTDCLIPQVSSTCYDALLVLGLCGASNGCGNLVIDEACYQANCPNEYEITITGQLPVCTFGTIQPCGSTIGACQQGTQTCEYGGVWGACSGAVEPVEEICGNSIDDDCDDQTDEPTFPWCADVDGDGALNDASCFNICESPGPEYVQDFGEGVYDCNDNNPDINPFQPEICGDGLDNDCDPITPDSEDQDSDTYDCSSDCDDANPDVNPGMTEICNDGLDNDCDTGTDDLFDTDGDGYSCLDDCNDNNAAINMDAPEICDAIDNNCDGWIDEFCGSCPSPFVVDVIPFIKVGDTFSAYNDFDPPCGSQSYGPEHIYSFTPATTASYILAITAADFDTTLYLLENCNDQNSCTAFADLAGNGGEIIEQTLASGTTYYIVVDGWAGSAGNYDLSIDFSVDADSDGYGTLTDCNDDEPTVNPEATEICNNSVDDDCDGATPDIFDGDGDGDTCNSDCDDSNPAISSLTIEVCNNSIDDDCNPLTPDIFDGDADGETCDTDCDDNNPAVNPGAAEVCNNSMDDDCDAGTPDIFDGDSDSWDCVSDCNDGDPAINPGTQEILCDSIDQNCNGMNDDDPLDKDGDGVASCTDCDDSDPANFPGNPEICGDNVDNNCSNGADEICSDDIYEPNDTLATASALSLPFSQPAVNACNADWYQISLSAGQTVNVDISFLNFSADLDLKLFHAGGELLAASTGSGNTENVSYLNQSGTTETIYINIVSFNEYVCSVYAIDISAL